MNRRHPVDHIFQDKLAGYEVDAPMHLWDRIDQQRDWKHKLRNHFRLQWARYAVGIGVLASLLLTASLLNQPEIDHFPIPMEMKTTAQLAPNQESTSTKVPIEPIQSTASLKTNVSNNTATLSSNSIHSEDTPSTIAFAEIPKVLAVEEQQDNASTTTQKPVIGLDNTIEKISSNSDANTAEIAAVIADDPVSNQSLSELLLLDGKTSSLPFLERALGDQLQITDTDCAKFGPEKGQIFVDFLVSPDMALREMSPLNEEYRDYVRQRQNTEDPSFAFSAALRVSVVSGAGFVMRSGLSYSQINEKFEYVDQSVAITTIVEITNNMGEVIGMDTIEQTGVRKKITHNTLRTLDLPIIMGYEMYYEKFAFSINAGPYLNLRFDQTGDFLSPDDLQPVSYSSNDPNGVRAFKKQLGVGWFGSLGFQYNIDKKLFLLVEPYFKIYPKSFTRKDFAAQQRYFTTGLSIGLRRQL
ncbi:MAG: hypothetical protein MRY78_21055 [Saprospiraceae bacterium]|nr:hypothetical protein [Saprospiraceae bacterium]